MNDYDVISSRATTPSFFVAPAPVEELKRNWGIEPMGYQYAGVEYAIRRDHAIIGDEPGLGKTAQGIMLSNAVGAKHTLVVCPASLRLNWEREVFRWSTLPNVTTYPILKSRDGVSLAHNYVIVSYDLLRNPSILHALLERPWDHVIYDEAHAIKDPKGNQRTVPICAPDLLPSVARRMTLLTGTLLPNQPIECLGADTLVLTDRGYKRIVEVTVNDLLWDGGSWVQHDGLADRGVKQTISVAGVEMTPDHLLLGASEKWFPASELASHDDILSQALATGSASLPSSGLLAGLVGGSQGSSSLAIAGALNTGPAMFTCEPGALAGAALAWPPRETEPEAISTSTFVPTPSGASGCDRGSAIARRDATTPTTSRTPTTADVEYSSTNRGAPRSKGRPSSSPTCLPSLGRMTRPSNWTASTTDGATSRATSVSSRRGQTPTTGAHSEPCKSASTSLRPVYDLVNAGPRQRFTILTDRGPLIVHNCYNAIRLLNWGAIDNASLEEFREYYYDFGEGWVTKRVYDHVAGRYTAKQEWSKHVRNAPRRMEELQFRLRKHLMVRRLKAQVLHMLPPKRWQPFPLELTAGIRSALKHPGWAEVQRLWEMDPENFDVAASFDGHAATARRELGEAKASGVAGYVEDMLESGVNKIVIGAWHRSVLAVLRELLTKIVGEQGIVYMDGGTSSGAKQRAVDAFQNDPRVKIMLGQKKPLGEGWTLTAAQDVVDAEIDGTPGVNEQFFDRINRMGQLGSHTTCHIPLVPQTLDEKIINRAVQRSRTIYKALDAA